MFYVFQNSKLTFFEFKVKHLFLQLILVNQIKLFELHDIVFFSNSFLPYLIYLFFINEFVYRKKKVT